MHRVAICHHRSFLSLPLCLSLSSLYLPFVSPTIFPASFAACARVHENQATIVARNTPREILKDRLHRIIWSSQTYASAFVTPDTTIHASRFCFLTAAFYRSQRHFVTHTLCGALHLFSFCYIRQIHSANRKCEWVFLISISITFIRIVVDL